MRRGGILPAIALVATLGAPLAFASTATASSNAAGAAALRPLDGGDQSGCNHQFYTPADCMLYLYSSTVEQGGWLGVKGTGFTRGATITISIKSGSTDDVVGTAYAGYGGTFSTAVRIPSVFPTGTATVIASGKGGTGQTLTESCTVTVVAHQKDY